MKILYSSSIAQYIYDWSLKNIQKFNHKKTPVFVLYEPFHYDLLHRVFVYLDTYELLVLNRITAEYLDSKRIAYKTHILFPSNLISVDFLNENQFIQDQFSYLFKLKLRSKTVKHILTFHGVIDKNWTFKKACKNYDLILCPGKYAVDRMLDLGITEKKIRLVGFPKYVKYYQTTDTNIPEINQEKKTLLYAPTFGLISSIPYLLKPLTHLTKFYNVIFKPHRYTEKYYMEYFERNNVIVKQDHDISKYFNVADIILSDTSSAMFEFAVTGKPVIVFDFNLFITDADTYNAISGPEMTMRHYFRQITCYEDLNNLGKIIGAEINRPKSLPLEIRQLIEPKKNPGKEMASAIMNYLASI